MRLLSFLSCPTGLWLMPWEIVVLDAKTNRLYAYIKTFFCTGISYNFSAIYWRKSQLKNHSIVIADPDPKGSHCDFWSNGYLCLDCLENWIIRSLLRFSCHEQTESSELVDLAVLRSYYLNRKAELRICIRQLKKIIDELKYDTPKSILSWSTWSNESFGRILACSPTLNLLRK